MHMQALRRPMRSVKYNWAQAGVLRLEKVADLPRYRGYGYLGRFDLGRKPAQVTEAHLIDNKRTGGGGGSRTRVRNPCQQRDSMLSRVPEISRDALRTDKMRVTLVR